MAPLVIRVILPRVARVCAAEGSHLVFSLGKKAKSSQLPTLALAVGQMVLPIESAANDQATFRAA